MFSSTMKIRKRRLLLGGVIFLEDVEFSGSDCASIAAGGCTLVPASDSIVVHASGGGVEEGERRRGKESAQRAQR
jgi:hypothetical protein